MHHKSLICFLLVLSGWGCTNQDKSPQVIHVFAASSLGESFEALARIYEAEHPKTSVLINTAGSQVLALQLEQGLRADSFASAHQTHIKRLVDGGILGESVHFADSRLVVVVPKGNVKTRDARQVLSEAQQIVVGHPSAPIGQYTEKLFEVIKQKYGTQYLDSLIKRVVSREKNVRLVRAKVVMGASDAAIVYETDAIGHSNVDMVHLPDALSIDTKFYLAQHRDASPQGKAWFRFLRSASAKKTLESFGFRVRY